MAFTFAVYTSDPNLLECELARLAPQVELPASERLNAAGVGSYAQDEVLLRRFPLGSPPRTLSELSPKHPSEALLYHAGLLKAGASVEENTQPLRFKNWLYCQLGDIKSYDRVRLKLQDELLGILQGHAQGELDADGGFGLFLQGLRQLGPWDGFRPPARQIAQCLLSAGQRLQALSSEVGAYPPDFSLLATHPQALVAARLGDEPLWYTRLEGSDVCLRCGTGVNHIVPTPKLRAHLQRRTVAVASKVSKPAGWLEIPKQTALAVDAAAQVFSVGPST
jgi:hypothetical protein